MTPRRLIGEGERFPKCCYLFERRQRLQFHASRLQPRQLRTFSVTART